MLTAKRAGDVATGQRFARSGKLFRRYWQPVAMFSDIPEDAPLRLPRCIRNSGV